MKIEEFLKKKFKIGDEKFEELKKNRDIFELQKIVKKMDRDFYKKSPFLSVAEELLWLLKEDLIEELVITSSFTKGRYPEKGDPRKIEKFQKTFGKFPQCKLKLRALTPDPINKEPRPFFNEWVKNNAPDFDLFIDDNQATIKKTCNQYKGEKRFYALPLYEFNKEVKGKNIYHVKQEVSDLTENDFAICDLEKRLERLEKEIKEEASKKSFSPFLLVTISLLVVGFLALFLFYYWLKKTKIKKKTCQNF